MSAGPGAASTTALSFDISNFKLKCSLVRPRPWPHSNTAQYSASVAEARGISKLPGLVAAAPGPGLEGGGAEDEMVLAYELPQPLVRGVGVELGVRLGEVFRHGDRVTPDRDVVQGKLGKLSMGSKI